MFGDDDDVADRDEARLHAAYREASALYAQFLEWRHKIILLCTTTLGLSVTVTTFAYREDLGGVAMSAPILAGAGVAYVCSNFDRRNVKLLRACEEAARTIEVRLFGLSEEEMEPPSLEVRGVFRELRASRQDAKNIAEAIPKGSYGWILRRAYIALAVILAAVAAVFLFLQVLAPATLHP